MLLSMNVANSNNLELITPGLTVTQTGIILETVEDTLLAERTLEFPLKLEIPLPKIDLDQIQDCNHNPQQVSIMSSVRKDIKRSILTNFHQVMQNAVHSGELKDFAETIKTHNTVISTIKTHRGKRASRNRRAFKYLSDDFVTLSGWTESKLLKQRTWSKNHFNITKRRIDSLGIAVQANTKGLETIREILCEQRGLTIEQYELEFQAQFGETMSFVALQMSQLENGDLPSAVTHDFIQDYCLMHFTHNNK